MCWPFDLFLPAVATRTWPSIAIENEHHLNVGVEMWKINPNRKKPRTIIRCYSVKWTRTYVHEGHDERSTAALSTHAAQRRGGREGGVVGRWKLKI